MNKSRICPHKSNDGEIVASIFQKNVMSPTHTISEVLAQHLGDSSHGDEEVNEVRGMDSEEEEPPVKMKNKSGMI